MVIAGFLREAVAGLMFAIWPVIPQEQAFHSCIGWLSCFNTCTSTMQKRFQAFVKGRQLWVSGLGGDPSAPVCGL